ncbi:MAG TPA: GNAT family N-acetyltransferase [Pseudonocardia sp.]
MDHPGLLTDLSVTVGAAPGPAPLAAWDELVAAGPDSDVAQLSAWAAVRAHAGYTPLYVLAWSGRRLLGGAMVLRRAVRGVGRIGYLPYGPVIADGDPALAGPGARQVVVEALASALSSVASDHLALFVQPPSGGADIARALLDRGFRTSTAGVAPAATIRVDLDRSEDELRARLTRRLRTWTRQWPQRGVTVRVGTAADVPILARLAADTARFQGFAPFPTEYLDMTYRQLSPGGHAVLMIGELHGRPVVAELLTGAGSVLKSRITGLDRSSQEAAKLNAASAVIWETIRWGRRNGYRAYDFGGVRPESVPLLRDPGGAAQDALPGPDLFKTKFGGDLHVYPPAVELIPSRVVRRGYDLLRRGGQDGAGAMIIDRVREALRGGR